MPSISLAGGAGRLGLEVSPEPADIYIDGQKKANASGVFKVSEGDHKVEIKKGGYETETLNVFVGEDAVLTKIVSLKRIVTKEEKIKIEKEKKKEEANMVTVPAGEFWYGCNKKVDSDCEDNEKTAVEIYLDEFKIDKYEVSAFQFSEFLNANGNPGGKYANIDKYSNIEEGGKFSAKAGYENYPVNNVSWHGADAYCKWVDKRLPTEAEWEKAARGTDGRKYPWGNEVPDESKARYNQGWNSLGLRVMVSVDSLEAGKSPYGVYNMSGNVWEWVADWYDADYYLSAPLKNPKGPATGSTRVLRGGSWHFDASSMRAATRYNNTPDGRSYDDGFRCSQ